MWRQVSLGTVAGLFALGMSAVAVGQEPDTYQALSRRNTITAPKRTVPRSSIAIPIDDSWWPFGRKEQTLPPALRVSTTPSPAALGSSGTAASAPSSNKERAAQLQKELDAYLRRMQVCDRLKEVAEETGDASLEQQAELMAQRAWFVYQQRTAQLRLPGLVPLDDREAGANLLSDSRRADDLPLRSVRAERTPQPEGGKPQP
ncbi:MAG TPA: hypothetical protein PKD86_11060 [Gemmatales bacterium]|nr:hypothetical protein [Gemmatales bacterium]HMP59884.1 hypothetical protein [Gemmatales bacterium]